MLDHVLAGRPLPVLVHGATGRAARRHIALMRGHGTAIVGGVAPGRGGTLVEGVPVFGDSAEAVAATGAVASVLMVPPLAVLPAVEDAVAGGLGLLVVVTEGVPALDTARAIALCRERNVTLIGPTTPGLAVPGRLKLGFLPEAVLKPGAVAVIARSGTLSYEVCHRLVQHGLGQSFWVGAGGDPAKGTRFRDFVAPLAGHRPTRALVVVGEIGGTDEEELAETILSHRFDRPVYAMLAGSQAPEGVTMGHAGALVRGGRGSLAAKTAALEAAGVRVFDRIGDLAAAVAAGPAGAATETE